MRQTMYMMTPAIAAVTRNVAMVTPMILPARLTLFILAMADAMEQNTIGTTTQNIMLMNTVPRGFSTVAPALSSVTGKIQPTMAPRIMEPSIMARNA